MGYQQGVSVCFVWLFKHIVLNVEKKCVRKRQFLLPDSTWDKQQLVNLHTGMKQTLDLRVAEQVWKVLLLTCISLSAHVILTEYV